jgi:hypothetical protein
MEEAMGGRRRTRVLALVAAAFTATALVPLTVTAAAAAEPTSSRAPVEVQAATWHSVGTETDAWCHKIGEDAKRAFGYPYKCVWHPPIKIGYSELLEYY